MINNKHPGPCPLGKDHQEPEDPTVRDILEATRRFHRLSMTRNPWARDFGLRPPEWFLLTRLRHLDEGQGVKPSLLAEALDVTPGAITQMLTRLENQDWLIRSADPHDRRVVRVSLSPVGRERMAGMRRALAATMDGLVRELGENECRQLARLLNKASDYFDRVSTAAAATKEMDQPC